MRKRKGKAKKALDVGKPKARSRPKAGGHKHRFDQLLDDAILGVKPKAPRD